jgi:hypothetical protein
MGLERNHAASAGDAVREAERDLSQTKVRHGAHIVGWQIENAISAID